jgi:imidazolonepropionase-like amidohydrolase
MISLLLLLGLPSLLPGQGEEIPRPKLLVLTHVTVIDATGALARPDMTVVIAGDRITELDSAKQMPVPNDAHVVDGTGKFLIPGLWDMHVHWYGYDKAYLRLFIANGVTGVRVMWGAPIHFQWRKEIQERALPAPRMVIASTIVDGPKPIWPASIGVSNESEARQVVRKVKQAGADFVKVYSALPREAYFAIADEAKKQGLPFAGHVPDSVSAKEASDAGQKSIEHLTGILAACSTQEQEWRKGMLEAFSNLPEGERRVPRPASTRPLTRLVLENFSPEKAATLFSRFRQNHTWQCPTFTVLRAFANLDNKEFTHDPRLKYMPATMRTQWDPARDFRFKERGAEDFDLARLVYKKHLEIVGMMHKAGVPFLSGTDVGNPYCFPGFSLHDELALLVRAGLTPMEALQAATLNPARFLGREKDLGTVEKGKMADLVLLEASPLEDISNTQKINAVVLNGHLLDRPTLDKMLTDVEAAAKKN